MIYNMMEEVIRDVYFDKANGFGSIQKTFEQAREIDTNIKFEDVKRFIQKQEHKQIQFKFKGHNSYVAKQPLEEIQIDSMEMPTTDDGYRYVFVAIDVFTKYCVAVPMKGKTVDDNVKAMKEVIEKMGKPGKVYGDFEGAWKSNEFNRLMNQHSLERII